MPRKDAGGRVLRATGGTGETSLPSTAEASEGSHPPRGSKLRGAGLHLVATPIGNADDITLRALATLKRADAVLCEDTRVTMKLLALHGIAQRLVAYHDHNAERLRPKVLDWLRQGQMIALVADAGTPLISDPGFKLVRAAIAEGLAVTAVPGPSAALVGLVLSGLPTDRFFFAGFLPARGAARRRALAEIGTIPATLLFFEAPGRLAEALADMTEVLGDRPASIARELTKLHEEVRRGSLRALAGHYAEEGPPRGEVVVVVAPGAAVAPSEDAVEAQLKRALATMSVKQATATVAAATGLPRRVLYARALALAGKGK